MTEEPAEDEYLLLDGKLHRVVNRGPLFSSSPNAEGVMERIGTWVHTERMKLKAMAKEREAALQRALDAVVPGVKYEESEAHGWFLSTTRRLTEKQRQQLRAAWSAVMVNN